MRISDIIEYIKNSYADSCLLKISNITEYIKNSYGDTASGEDILIISLNMSKTVMLTQSPVGISYIIEYIKSSYGDTLSG